MLINGWLLVKRLNGRVQATGVESDCLLFVAPIILVLLNVVGLVLVSRGQLVSIARVMHPLGCTRGRGRRSRGRVWCSGDNLEGSRLVVVAVLDGLSR